MTTNKKKKILVFSLFTLSFAAAAAILDFFSHSSFWKKKPNPEQGGGGGGGGPPDDRISELPVEILHHILGFLEMDEFLIGTSLVSTKWRNLWKSVPVLNFSHGHSSSRISGSSSSSSVDNGSGGGIRNNNVENFHKLVDCVLDLRDSEASKIEIFRYCCYSELRDYDYLVDLHDFTVNAANQGAQEIQVQGYNLEEESSNNNNAIHFNPSIFTSLRKFTFDVFLGNFLIIQFPPSIFCATQLTHLTLIGIRLPEGGGGDDAAQLHLVCPVLETFHMSYCYTEHLKVLDISAPRLYSLSICNSGMRRRHFDGLGGCRLEIRTPNLTTLIYSGHVYVDCFTENLPRIARASLLFSEIPGMLEQTTSFAIKLLKGLTSAKSLTLKGFEVFKQDTLKDLLTPFTSLTNLWFFTSCNISSIHGMVHLLNNCNSLEKLSWDVNEFVEVEGDEHLMLPQCRLSHLKHVHIKRLRGHENEIEFVKFLLKSSVVLEEIIIHTIADSPKQSIEENLKQFIEEEPSLRRCIKLEIL